MSCMLSDKIFQPPSPTPRAVPCCDMLSPPLSGLELGGLLGGTLSGVLSDKTIKAAGPNPSVGLVGRRVQICMAYTVACIGVLFALKGVPAGELGLRFSQPL